MPYDLIFYASSALIFVGIIVASRRARRAKREAEAAQNRPVATMGRDSKPSAEDR